MALLLMAACQKSIIFILDEAEVESSCQHAMLSNVIWTGIPPLQP